VSLDGAGLATLEVEEANGTLTTTARDGTVITEAQTFDPRFGMQAPIINRTTIRTPSGSVATVIAGRRTVLANPADPASLVSQVDSLVANGRLFRNTYVAATRTSTAVTPEGRSSTERLDPLGRVIEEAEPGVAPVGYEYDTRGRISHITQSSRLWSYTFDAQGRVAVETDPLNRNSQTFYDLGDRLTRQVLTDGRELLFGYDVNGNRQSVTPPGRQPHQFQYNALNLPISYSPPSLGSGMWNTTYQYDLNRRLTQVVRPDGQTITLQYDAAGRPNTTTIPDGAVQYTYDPATGKLVGVSGPYGGSLSFTHDGSLLTGVTWAGEVAGTMNATHNADFQLTGVSVNGGPSVGFTYDRDGQLITAGALTISRSPSTGFITGTTLDAIVDGQVYTPYGQLAVQAASASGNALFNLSYTRDSIGRITESMQTVGGATTTRAYTYDPAGRLTEVRENAALMAIYEYDANGNRLRATRPSGVELGTYDAQDRLVAYGSATYAYDRNGALNTKTVASDSTRYEYDVLGNLRRVTLPDGTLVEYIVDGMKRRVAKKVNGVMVKGWLYQNQLNPVAELDGQGNVVSQFVYGTRPNVPDYLVRNGTTYRIIADQLGSVRLVTESLTGNVVQRIDYDEWGKVTQNTNPDFQPFGYAGGLYDAHTKLVRFGARDYDAEIGRWTIKDPILFGGNDSNLYAYVGSDPVNARDASGFCPSDCERFAKAAGSMARHSRSAEDFIRGMGKVFAGFPTGKATPHPGPVNKTLGLDDTGFRDELNDHDHHPWRHFSAFAVVGFDRNVLLGNAFSVIHENRLAAGSSIEDVRLGDAGVAFGRSLAKGWLPLSAVEQWILDNICEAP
jgi:RHS repeat-associated protein